MKAKVIKAFDGAPDGAIYPKHFNVGDVVEGDLAKVAVGQQWAEELGKDEVAPTVTTIDIPANWREYDEAKVIALAVSLGAPKEVVRTRGVAMQAIEAEIARRATSNKASVEIPADWQTLNAAESITLAQSLGAGEDVKVKAAAQAFISAEVEKRKAETEAAKG